ncbi:MAG: hypothetical protein KAH95_13095 [Spirochaetales bacterium]|nr:hypothetical protein [Spirochaetales bacterium]
MLNETTKIHRTIMAVTAIVAGVYLIMLAPTQAMQTLKIAMDQAFIRLVPHDADFYPAIPILSATFSVWIVLLVFAGALSLLLAKKLYDGAEWARAAALGVFSIPAVSGMTMVIPWFVLVLAEYPDKGVPAATVSGMPPVLPVMFLGLLFYYIILMADKDSIKNKLLKFVPYTFIGIVSGMVFMNGQHGVRYFIHIPGAFDAVPPHFTSPLAHYITNLDHLDWLSFEFLTEHAVYSPQTLALLLGGYLNYISAAMLIIAIPFLAMKKKVGYYMATTAALATAAASFQGFFVRHSTEWLQGGFLSTALLIILLLPVFKKFFIPEEEL